MTEFYKSKYKKTPIREHWHRFLIHYLKYLTKTKIGKYLDPLDSFHLSRLDILKSLNKYYLEHSKKKIRLRRIEFIEVIELDDLAVFEKQIFKIVKENKFYDDLRKGVDLSASKISELRDIFDKFKNSYKTWVSGKFFELTNEKPNHHTDLYEYISFNYFKSYDNLLVLKLDVEPSKKFFKLLKSINKNKTVPNDKPRINHFRDFLRTKRIIRGFRAIGNLKEKGFNNLLYDLNYQIKTSFFDGMNGVFTSRNEQNPFLAYFNTKSLINYKELRKGFGVFDNFDLSNIFYDQENKYYIHKYWRSGDKGLGLYVIAEDDGFQDSVTQDNHNKRLNEYIFKNSMYKSWAILNYLKFLNNDLKYFRNTVYNFIKSNGNLKFSKQIEIKTRLSQRKIRFQRIKKEFDKSNLDFYLLRTDYNSRKLRAISNDWGRNQNYHEFIRKEINYFITDGKEQLTDLDKYFEEISAINLIKLNYRFQLIAIVLAVLGLIFALANAEDIFNLIKKLWQ